MSYLKGRISRKSFYLISECRSEYLFKKLLDRAVEKWGIKTGTNEKIRLFREMN